MIFNYKPKSTCATNIKIELDGNIIKKVEFTNGCNGNLKAISSLVEGLSIDDVEKRLKGITCGPRPTSCSDQLCLGLRNAYEEQLKGN